MTEPQKTPLRHNADFTEQLTNSAEDQVRRDLDLPNVQDILRELQERHGVRLTLTKSMVDRMASLKATEAAGVDHPSACSPNDICILCDRHDICVTCDAMDWCVTVDYHVVEEVVE
jgi:uncharacterized protein YaiI (UPF0178 family)